VLPGLPAEMRAMFDAIADEFSGEPPIGSWRRTYKTREQEIVGVLTEVRERFPSVLVGSYPSFEVGPEVEVVLKSSDANQLAAAVDFVTAALDT
jgi:molybdopterin-biosynthesis enzyme MoeA-like protein